MLPLLCLLSPLANRHYEVLINILANRAWETQGKAGRGLIAQDTGHRARGAELQPDVPEKLS